MDKLKYVDGLPPGFRFQPTEEELVFQYLKCKVFSSALPASIIPEINLCNYDPWDLPVPGGGDTEEDRYLFTIINSSSEPKYATPSGYWKKAGTGCDKTILSCNDHHVGMKKTLVFYKRKPCRRGYSKTAWIMHQYRLVSTSQNSAYSSTSKKNIGRSQMEINWVLCRIFCKKMTRAEDNKVILGEPTLFYDFMRDDTMSSTASSSSSTATEITSRISSPPGKRANI